MKREEPTFTEDLQPKPFISRWSVRKQSARQSALEVVSPVPEVEETEAPVLTDADMPPLDSLDEKSDYSGFLSPRVSDELRQLALRKLFLSDCFNVCDGLDDYADDFTSFAKLGDVITADMRHRLQMEAEKARQLAQSSSEKEESEVDESVQKAAEESPSESPTQLSSTGEQEHHLPDEPLEERDVSATDESTS